LELLEFIFGLSDILLHINKPEDKKAGFEATGNKSEMNELIFNNPVGRYVTLIFPTGSVSKYENKYSWNPESLLDLKFPKEHIDEEENLLTSFESSYPSIIVKSGSTIKLQIVTDIIPSKIELKYGFKLNIHESKYKILSQSINMK